ncbi:MAG: hypothetical protein Q9218_001655 [Villophora microphyllina]
MECMKNVACEGKDEKTHAVVNDAVNAVYTVSDTERTPAQPSLIVPVTTNWGHMIVENAHLKAKTRPHTPELVPGMKRKTTPPKWFTPKKKAKVAAEDVTDELSTASANLSKQTKRMFPKASDGEEEDVEKAVKKIRREGDDVSGAVSGNMLACNDYDPQDPGTSNDEADSGPESEASSEDNLVPDSKERGIKSDNENAILDPTSTTQIHASNLTDSSVNSESPTVADAAENSPEGEEDDASTRATTADEGYATDTDNDPTSADEASDDGDEASEEEEDNGDAASEEEDDSGEESAGTRWRIAHGLQEERVEPSAENDWYLGDGWYGDDGVQMCIW